MTEGQMVPSQQHCALSQLYLGGLVTYVTLPNEWLFCDRFWSKSWIAYYCFGFNANNSCDLYNMIFLLLLFAASVKISVPFINLTGVAAMNGCLSRKA